MAEVLVNIGPGLKPKKIDVAFETVFFCEFLELGFVFPATDKVNGKIYTMFL